MSLERLFAIAARVSAISRMLHQAPPCGAIPSALSYITIDPAQALADICAGTLASGSGGAEQWSDAPDISGRTANKTGEALQRRPLTDPRRWQPAGQLRRSSLLHAAIVNGEILKDQTLASFEHQFGQFRRRPNLAAGATKLRSALGPAAEVTPQGFSSQPADNSQAPAARNTANLEKSSKAGPSLHLPYDTASGRPSRVTPAALSAELEQTQSLINLEPASDYASQGKPAARDVPLSSMALAGSAVDDDANPSGKPSSSSTSVQWVRSPEALVRVLRANLAMAQTVPDLQTAAGGEITRTDSSFPEAFSPQVEGQRPRQNPQWDVEFLLEELERRLRLEYHRTYGTSGGL